MATSTVSHHFQDVELAPGVTLYQVTCSHSLVSNIYCEQGYASHDSRHFLYWQDTGEVDAVGQPVWRLIQCEFGSWQRHVVGEGRFDICVSHNNDFFFFRQVNADDLALLQVDRSTGHVRTAWRCPTNAGPFKHPTVSANGRWLAYHKPLSYHPQRFGVVVVDLASGDVRVVLERPDIWNAHLQFHPTDLQTLLVQINRGAQFAPDGTRLKRFGDEGNTLVLLDAVTGEVQPLMIGLPHTQPVTGHEAWLGNSSDMIATVYPPLPDPTDHLGLGNIVTVRKGEPSTFLPTGEHMIHVGSTRDGRYFHADHIRHNRIIIGSPRTGRVALIHQDPQVDGRATFGQQSHPHAYLTDDFRWIVFNSDRTGWPQVYVASIPESLIRSLD